MLIHLVEGHLGGWYTSTENIDYIEEYCDECGDYDRVIASFDDEIKNDKIRKIAECFIDNSITNKDIFELRIKYLLEDGLKIEDIKKNIKSSLSEDYYYNKSIVRCLIDSGIISIDESKEIINILNNAIKEQCSYVSNYDYSNIKIDNATHKLRIRKKY